MSNLQNIDSSAAYRRFLDLYRAHNEKCVAVPHTRKTIALDGTEIESTINRRTGLLPEQIKTTFHQMLQHYTNNYNNVVSSMPAFVYEGEERLPSLLINNARLGEYCDCTDRTIYNHRKVLESLGCISTRFRGRKHDYELWITNEILFGTEEEAKTENAQNAPKKAFSGSNMKTFPLSNNLSIEKEKETISKDMLDCGQGKNNQGKRGRTETAHAPISEAVELGTESGAGGVAAVSARERAAQMQKERQLRADAHQSSLAQMPPRLEKYFADMLVSMWMYAWKVLYSGRDFTKDQQEKAIEAIYVGVYNRFEDERTASEWVDFQTLQIEKLDKVAKYLDNHPEAYLPDPYSVQIAGKGYFDRENDRGFIGVDAWAKRDRLKAQTKKDIAAEKADKREQRAETLLRQARRDFEKMRIGSEMRKEVRHLSQIQLWNYYRVIFAGIGKKYERMFAEQYLAQQANDFKEPSYYKPRRKQQYKKASERQVVMVEDWMTWGNWY